MLFYFSTKMKIGFDISCKLSPKETMCMLLESLIFSKNKKTILKCRLLKFYKIKLFIYFSVGA